MKVLGIGVDIIKNSRIKKSITSEKFIKRVYSKYEITKSMQLQNKLGYFSKRFAAKEAFSKALGTGFRENLQYKDISIINDKYGKPSLKINNKLNKILMKKFTTKKINILLSLSDEKNYSIAFIILEKK